MNKPITSIEQKVNKNNFKLTFRNRRIDVMKNGLWIGKGYFENSLEFTPALHNEEFSWLEKTVKNYYSNI